MECHHSALEENYSSSIVRFFRLLENQLVFCGDLSYCNWLSFYPYSCETRRYNVLGKFHSLLNCRKFLKCSQSWEVFSPLFLEPRKLSYCRYRWSCKREALTDYEHTELSRTLRSCKVTDFRAEILLVSYICHARKFSPQMKAIFRWYYWKLNWHEHCTCIMLNWPSGTM